MPRSCSERATRRMRGEREVVADVVGVPAGRVAVRRGEVEGARHPAARLLGDDLVEQPVAALARGQRDGRARHAPRRVLGRLRRAHAAHGAPQREAGLHAGVARVDRAIHVVAERDDAAPPLGQQSPRADPQPRLGVAAELEQQRVDHRALERPRARARRGAGEQAPAGVERGRVGDRLVGLVGQPEAQRGEQVERELGAGRRGAGPGRLRAAGRRRRCSARRAGSAGAASPKPRRRRRCRRRRRPRGAGRAR